jgi:hypothetical protein
MLMMQQRGLANSFPCEKMSKLILCEILEANCAPAKNIVSRTRRACSRLFVTFFPIKKEVPEYLGKLVKVFDTPEDPTLAFKCLSTNVDAEITMALAMLHGEEVNWEKVSASLAKDEGGKALDMKAFFIEAKKYLQKLVSLILLAPTTSATPSSNATPASSTIPSEVP